MTVTVNDVGNGTREGLVAAYGFEETAGAQALDASGNGNDGALFGTTRTESGRFGNALSFDGVDDWVTIEHGSSLELAGAMTVEAWVFPTASSNWSTIVAKESTGDLAFALYASGTAHRPAARFGLNGQTDVQGESPLPLNTWTHLAATYDGSFVRLYVNGSETDTQALSGGITASSNPLRIGGNSVWLDESFEGRIDEVRIYDRQLTLAEIRTDMTVPVVGGTPPPAPGLVDTGEVVVNHEWKRVHFNRPFSDPVVVASSMSSNDSDPAVVRIRNVDNQGFEIRLQEWEDQDGVHGFETVGFLIVENGSHTLPDGTRIEAGRIQTDARSAFDFAPFDEPFAAEIVPVVFASVTTFNETAAVATQIQAINADGFDVRMRELDASSRGHQVETISFVAWEPVSGTIDGTVFEVSQTTETGKHDGYTVQYQNILETQPIVLTSMQTTNSGDTSTLRWRNRTPYSVEVWIDEEQSGNTETNHASKKVGYGIFRP